MVRAEYNSSNNFTRKLFEEILPEYDQNLTRQIISENKSIIDDCAVFYENSLSFKQHSFLLKPWTIEKANREPIYFTMYFPMSTVKYIPSYFKSLHYIRGFTKYDCVEYIPCYLMNLNHVALIKLRHPGRNVIGKYSNFNQDLFSQAIHNGGKPMELSSLNILLSGATQEEDIIPSSQDIIKQCFKLCYWCLPNSRNSNGISTIHNLIYHKDRLIQEIAQLRKTLLRVINIKTHPRPIKTSSGRELNYVKADVSLLVDDTGSISSEFHKDVFLSTNVSQSVNQDDILIVLMEAPIKIKQRSWLVIGHVETSVANIGDMKPLLSIVLWKYLQHIDKRSSITKAEDIHQISDCIKEIVDNNSSENDLFYQSFMWNVSVNNLTKSIKELYPLYILQNDIVHQASPTLLSFIMTTFPDMLNNEKLLHILINLLNIIKMDSYGREKESYFSLINEKFQSISSASAFPEFFLKNLPYVVNRMVYSRIFSKH